MSVKISSDYVNLLNKAVSRELQVSIQYMLQHAKMEKLMQRVVPENILLDKTTYDKMGTVLREFAVQEMKHAANIIERIYYLGGDATTKSEKPALGNSLNEFAKLGIKAEEEALVLYRKVIEEAAKLGDWETRELFEKIYAGEEAHLFRFQEYMDIKDETATETLPTSEWRKIFTDDYLKLLNKAAASEISAIIQYTNQHEKASLLALRKRKTAIEVITDANKDQVISNLLKEVFMQEMDHLEKISERIFLLDGEATPFPDPLPQVGADANDFLKLGKEAENDAILLYRQIITEALKRGDTLTRRMFEDIVIQEEEHYWKFDDFMK